ncbi:hypothetical protein AAVH_10329 [Aphelenchoides avenae]|nr:hypothetical protein AAVH_10329 [Aphelenchus avenae]
MVSSEYKIELWNHGQVDGMGSAQECLDFAWEQDTTSVVFCFVPSNGTCLFANAPNVYACATTGGSVSEQWYFRSDGRYTGDEVDCLTSTESQALIDSYVTCA